MAGPKKDSTKRNPIKLTKEAVSGLVVEPTAYIIPVVNSRGQALQGLSIRVLSSGLKVWIHRFRFNGIQSTLTLGRWPAMTCDAAEKASKAAQVAINSGINPNQAKVDAKVAEVEKRRAAVTMQDLADKYVAEHIPNNSDGWGKEAGRLIRLHILPLLGKKTPVAAVGPADVSALMLKMKSTPIQANRTKAVLRTMFTRAIEWELYTEANPVSRVKTRSPETKRDRRLSDVEMKSLGKVLRDGDEALTVKLAVQLALLAGMRKGEVAGLRWSWVDLEAGEIRIPPDFHKTGKKTGKTRVVHICDALVAHLRATAQTIGCPYVVPGKPKKGEDGKTVWAPYVGLQTPWERIRSAAGLAPTDDDGEYLDEESNPGWHDLRRTFASVGTDLGLKGFVGELLGHAEATVTDIYTRAAAEALHDAAEKIGGRIEGILSGAVDPEKEAEERREAKASRKKAMA
jgi:integrase